MRVVEKEIEHKQNVDNEKEAMSNKHLANKTNVTYWKWKPSERKHKAKQTRKCWHVSAVSDTQPHVLRTGVTQ